jgi:hypothetical protein
VDLARNIGVRIVRGQGCSCPVLTSVDMAAAGFVHEIDIAVARPRLHDFLCDLENFTALHPLIESITEIAPTAELPNARRYRVVDRVPIGPGRMKAVYTATLDPVSLHEVRGYAWQKPGIRLLTAYEIADTNTGVHLTERVSVHAPWVLRRFVSGQAEASHLETMKKIKVLLEQPATPV